MLSIDFNLASFRNDLNRLVVATGADAQQLCREEMRLALVEIRNRTAPFSKYGAKSNTAASASGDKQAGEGAIGADLFGGKRVRRSSGGSESSVGILQRIGSSSQVPPRPGKGHSETTGVRLGWEGSKTIRIMTKFWRPNASMSEVEEFHRKNRDRRGRTSMVSRSVIGRWRVQDQMWVNNSVADQYYRMIKDRVGKAKAVFNAAASRLGLRTPPYILRHGYRGTYSEGNKDTPYVSVSGSSYIPNYQRVIDESLALRAKRFASEVRRIVDQNGKSRRKSLAGTASGKAA